VNKSQKYISSEGERVINRERESKRERERERERERALWGRGLEAEAQSLDFYFSDTPILSNQL
jgi:hypothetical protein